MVRWVFFFFLVLILSLDYAQNRIQNYSFERVDSCWVDPKYGPSTIVVDWRNPKRRNYGYSIRTESLGTCSLKSSLEPVEGNNVLELKFLARSNGVDDLFIQTSLKKTMERGKRYTIGFYIAKEKFSAGNLKELQVLFTTSAIRSGPVFRAHNWKSGFVNFDLSEVSTSYDWYYLEATYLAQGNENYFSIGSFGQKFSLKEAARTGNFWFESNVPGRYFNAIYYIDSINCEVIKEKELEKVPGDKNFHDLAFNDENFVLNSGFENGKHPSVTPSKNALPGISVAPNWFSLNTSSPRLSLRDSTIHISKNSTAVLPYMGSGFMSFTVLKTNKYHIYKEVKSVRKTKNNVGNAYDIIHHYELSPKGEDIPAPYLLGSYLVGTLKDSLLKDSLYQFQSMLKLSSTSAFGTPYFGVYFLDQIPSNFYDSTFQRLPDIVFDASNLATSTSWKVFQGDFYANGKERFFVIGYFEDNADKVVRNHNFKPTVSNAYGGVGNKSSSFPTTEHIYYRDSLFAEYFIDNVCIFPGSYSTSSASIYGNQTNQLEVVYTTALKGNSIEENRFIKAKSMIVAALEVLRSSDGICIVDLHKVNEIILEPVSIVNRRKIVRKINAPKLRRKKMPQALDEGVILFSGEHTEGFNNHLVLMTDGSLDFTTSIDKLTRFCENGGFLTLLCMSNKDPKGIINPEVLNLNQVMVIDLNSPLAQEAFLRRIVVPQKKPLN